MRYVTPRNPRNRLDFATIRARNPLPAVIGASIKLRRFGQEWKACCPFHADRSPSFTIFDEGERFHCFGCGATGDVLDYVQRAYRVSLGEAVDLLHDGNVPMLVQPKLQPRPDRDTTAEAIAIWRSAGPISRTSAETYLHARGLHLRLPKSLRFARLPFGRGKSLPCVVALVEDVEKKIIGIQRTFVREDGSGKADVPTPKLSLGRISGGAIRLAPAGSTLVVTGGLEDGLTLQQELGHAVWCAAGEGNLANMVLPPSVKSVVIGADRDDCGEAHAQRAANAYSLQGRSVRIIRPVPGHKDFNAELRGVRA